MSRHECRTDATSTVPPLARPRRLAFGSAAPALTCRRAGERSVRARRRERPAAAGQRRALDAPAARPETMRPAATPACACATKSSPTRPCAQPVRSGEVMTDAVARLQRARASRTGLAAGPRLLVSLQLRRCASARSAARAPRPRRTPTCAACGSRSPPASTTSKASSRRTATSRGSDLDLVLFVGDYIYEGSSPAYAHAPATARPTPHTLDDYRARHALYKRDADLQAAHAAHPWIADLGRPRGGQRLRRRPRPGLRPSRRASCGGVRPPTAPTSSTCRCAAAARARRCASTTASPGAALAELWTLDCRQYRSHHACPDPARDVGRSVTGCAELADPARTHARRRRRNAGSREGLAGVDAALEAARPVHPDEHHRHRHARRAARPGPTAGTATRPRAGDCCRASPMPACATWSSLGGDVHRHVAANLRLRPNDAASPIVASEFVGGSITSRGAGQARDGTACGATTPMCVHARGDERGWALIDMHARAAALRVARRRRIRSPADAAFRGAGAIRCRGRGPAAAGGRDEAWIEEASARRAMLRTVWSYLCPIRTNL